MKMPTWTGIKGFVRHYGVAVLLCLVLVNSLLLAWEDNRRSDRDRLNAERRTAQAVDELKDFIATNNDLTREAVELLTCIVVLEGGNPEGLITVNPELCRKRLSGTNNLDGTFLRGGSNGSNGQPAPQPSKPQPSPQPTTEPGLLQRVQNTLEGLL